MGSRPKVFLNQGVAEVFLERLKETCDVTMYDEASTGKMMMSRDELLKSIQGYNAIWVVLPVKVDAELLDAAGPQLKVIATQSVGLDHVDIKECTRRGVKVGYTPDVLTDAVAEATIALMMSVTRRHKEAMRAVTNSEWGTTWSRSVYLCGPEIKNSVVGIVGLGRIGTAVAKILQGFNVSQLLYTGRSEKASAPGIGAKFVPFEELLEKSDVVIATCSINAENQKLFNADAFRRMKTSAIFINTTRGALVDQEALYEALTSGGIRAAGLDVTTPEPLPADHPLVGLPNCTILPHIGSASVVARHGMMDLSVRNIQAGLKGEALVTPVPQG